MSVADLKNVEIRTPGVRAFTVPLLCASSLFRVASGRLDLVSAFYSLSRSSHRLLPRGRFIGTGPSWTAADGTALVGRRVESCSLAYSSSRSSHRLPLRWLVAGFGLGQRVPSVSLASAASLMRSSGSASVMQRICVRSCMPFAADVAGCDVAGGGGGGAGANRFSLGTRDVDASTR